MSSPSDGEATVGLPHAGKARSEALLGQRFGDVTLEVALILGPGAWLYKGRDPRGRRALVQVTLLQPVAAAQTAARDAVIAEAGAATDAMARDPEVKVEAHGFEPEAADGGALYWRLPWTGAAERIGHTRLSEPEDLVAAASSLLERLAARHARGRFDPLLDASLVVPRTGGADLVGLPVRVPTAWLAPEMRGPHDAPEERSVGEPRRSGDLWRLGHALRALGSQLATLPMGFDAFLDRLTDPEPSRRLASASDALVELEGLQGTLATSERAELFPEREVLQASAPAPRTEVDAPSELADADEEHTLADVPVGALDGPPIDPAVQPRAASADEAPTMWMKREDVSKAPRASTSSEVQPMGPKGTVVGVRLGDAEREPALGANLQPRSLSSPPTRVFDDPATHPPKDDGGAAARARAGFASGQLGPGGTVAGSPAQILAYGPGGTVAAERPPVVSAPPPAVGPPPAAPPPPAAAGPAPEPLPAPSSPRRLALTVVLLLLLAVGAGVLVQLLKPRIDSQPVGGEVPAPSARTTAGQRQLTPWNDVLLETVPADAWVIGERDGASLGPSPVRLLVPVEDEVAVLVTAPGYEPVRLVLPTRGRVTVHLTSTGGVLDCPVDVQAPGTKPLEVVGLDISADETRRYAIPGAVVMRSAEGQGAWLVRCATYGGQRRHRFVSRALGKRAALSVTEPKGAQLTVDGGPAGTAPAQRQITPGFVKVEASTDDGGRIRRWIPAFGDVQVQLPRPAPAKEAD